MTSISSFRVERSEDDWVVMFRGDSYGSLRQDDGNGEYTCFDKSGEKLATLMGWVQAIEFMAEYVRTSVLLCERQRSWHRIVSDVDEVELVVGCEDARIAQQAYQAAIDVLMKPRCAECHADLPISVVAGFCSRQCMADWEFVHGPAFGAS